MVATLSITQAYTTLYDSDKRAISAGCLPQDNKLAIYNKCDKKKQIKTKNKIKETKIKREKIKEKVHTAKLPML